MHLPLLRSMTVITTQPHECGDDGQLKPAAQYICELALWGQRLEREVALLRTDYCTRDERNTLQAQNKALQTRVAELETILRDALGGFECTQIPAIYPADHWSNRAIGALKH